MANDEANIRALEERIRNLELHNRQQEPQFIQVKSSKET